MRSESKSHLLVVDTSPHIFSPQTTDSIMRDVMIALVPALLGGIYFFGFHALRVTAISIAGCMACEWIFQKIMQRPNTLGDCSAAVTGMLFAFCLPSSLPWWMILSGAFVCIIIGKQLFGGLGYNPYNPALVGRAVLLASWPQAMTTWHAPVHQWFSVADTITTATPLAGFKEGQCTVSIIDLFTGNCAGSVGETSALLLLIGGMYLVGRKVISLTIPLTFIGSVFIFSYLIGKNPLFSILSGGIFLGAFFMATDYVTSPMSNRGKIIFGISCGILTVLIRVYGGFPEGVCYAILFMNGLVPLLDRFTKPKIFGVSA